MDKFAQRRSFFSKMREKANITGKILESLNPEFRDMMDKVRDSDTVVREHAENIKDLIRSARSLYRRRDYLSCATNIGAFHERCRYIAAELEKLKRNVNLKHYEFILDQFDDTAKEQLFSYNPNEPLKTETAVLPMFLQKQAGLSDWWYKIKDPIADIGHNLLTEKGIAMKSLEKRFSIAFLKTLRADTGFMLGRAEDLLNLLLGVFKRLSSAMATRNIDEYIKNGEIFIKRFNTFHGNYVKYYEKNITPLKKYYEDLKKKEAPLVPKEKSVPLEEAKTELVETIPPSDKKVVITPNVPELPAGNKKLQEFKDMLKREQEKRNIRNPFYDPHAVPSEEAGKTLEKLRETQGPEDLSDTHEEAKRTLQQLEKTQGPEAIEENLPFNLQKKQEFINSLVSYAKENNIGKMVNRIVHFANDLSDTNLQDKLLVLAQGIMDEYEEGNGDYDDYDMGEDEGDDVEPATPPVPLNNPKKKVNFDLNIGRIDKPYREISTLKHINADKIKSSPATDEHILNIFIARLNTLDEDVAEFGVDIRFALISALKQAIMNGFVVAGHEVSDAHHPEDILLEILVKLPLSMFNLNGSSKLKVFCRYGAKNNSLTLRTIQRNFLVE